MNFTEFEAICNELNIEPSIALENKKLEEALIKLNDDAKASSIRRMIQIILATKLK